MIRPGIGECSKCGEDCWKSYDVDVCSTCYIPKNPTFGWMFAEYRRRGLSENDLRIYRTKNKTALERFLYRALDIKPIKETIKQRDVDER